MMYCCVVLAAFVMTISMSRAFRALRINHNVVRARFSDGWVTGNKLRMETNDDVNPQYAEWEMEEIELQKQETQAKINEIRADGDPIPEYMLKLLNQFSPEDNVPMVEAKLPIVAVIGRPNTGKSTIVNKLANCHKVCYVQCCNDCVCICTSEHHRWGRTLLSTLFISLIILLLGRSNCT
jgi:hypothetical protein